MQNYAASQILSDVFLSLEIWVLHGGRGCAVGGARCGYEGGMWRRRVDAEVGDAETRACEGRVRFKIVKEQKIYGCTSFGAWGKG